MRRMVGDAYFVAGLIVASASGMAGLFWSGSEARAQVERAGSFLAEIVSVRGDEDTLLIGTGSWQPALVAQGLIGGDRLRTGDFGGAAILFRDRTQIRVHSNSQLRLAAEKDMSGRTVFGLDFGQVWGRAVRPEDQLIFETPFASAAVRGTDWSLSVEPDGATRLLVFEGVVELANALGTISIGAGETGIARPGQPPMKEFVIRSPEAAHWALRIDIGWIEMLPVSLIRPSGRPTGKALTAAKYYDLGDFDAAEAALADLRRPSVIAALLAIREGRFEDARVRLGEISVGTDSRELAALAEIGLLIEQNRFDAAAAQLRSIDARTAEVDWRPDALRVWLDAYAGNLDKALGDMRRLRMHHPDVARLATLEAVVLTLRGEYAAALAAGREGAALDPEDYLAHYWVGVPAMQAEPTPDVARAAFKTALGLKPDHVHSLTKLALIDYLQGEYLEAKVLRQTALVLAPLDPDAVSGLVESLVEEDRVEEARALINGLPEDVLMGTASIFQARAYVALAEGRLDDGIEDALSSLAISPGYPGSGIALGIGLYEKEQFDAARSSFETAARLDPNDPLAPYYESLVAQAQWDADGAIVASRETVERLREGAGGLALADTVGVRDGEANVNVGYTMIGLDGWADYFLAQARSPYSANSLFDESFNSQNRTDRANAARIGILLDPMAFSIANRYIQFVRAPVTYNSIGASIGGGDGLFETNAFWQTSGFRRDPMPFAFLLEADGHYEKDLNIDRSQSGLGEGLIGFGLRPTSKDFLVAQLNFEFEDPATPGIDDDKDESASSQWLQGYIGWQRRYALDDRLAVNLTFDLRNDEERIGDSLFDGFSDLDASLYGHGEIGPVWADFILAQQINDLTADIPDCRTVTACYMVNLPPPLDDFFPEPETNLAGLTFETDPLAQRTRETRNFEIQLRRFRTDGPVDWSVGLEGGFLYVQEDDRLNWPSVEGESRLYFVNSPGFVELPYLDASSRIGRKTTEEIHYGEAYAIGTFHANRDLLIEAGLAGFWKREAVEFDLDLEDGTSYWRDPTMTTSDDEASTTFSLDPRVGFAWQPNPSTMLRAAMQSKSLPFGRSSIAPVGVVGLTMTGKFAREADRITSAGFRLDREWSQRVFTYVAAEAQWIEEWEAGPTDFTGNTGDDAFAATAQIETDIRIGKQGGLALRYAYNETENLDDDYRGNDLPFMPKQTASSKLYFISPRMWEAELGLTWEGESAADLGNSDSYDGSLFADTLIRWQPDDRHWDIALAATKRLTSGSGPLGVPDLTTRISVERRW